MFLYGEVPKNSAIFKGVTEGLKACKSIKKTPQHKCFPITIVKLRPAALLKSGTPTQLFSCKYYELCKSSFFIENLYWLLLIIVYAIKIKKTGL